MIEVYPWYSIIEGSELRQGDIILDCSVIVPSNGTLEGVTQEGATLNAEILTYDVVIMSQSCDLENEKLDLVLVCPHWGFKEFSEKLDHLKSKQGKIDLQRGNLPGYHLLNRCDLNDWSSEPRVVDFRSVYSLPYGYLKQLCVARGPRLRLLPPYREHLSQAFARFFMRVGLPASVSLDGK